MTTAIASSFRDPSGFVFERDGTLYRQVDRSFAEQFDLLASSGLYGALVREGILVPHEEVDPGIGDDGAYKVLRPERVATISYPYEWTPAQLREAALATLRAQELALDHGMTLRDASAYNVQFHRGRPVLIDTLSFERRREGQPWVAYRQFCQHFLAPLALETSVDVHLGQLLRADIDGIDVAVASAALPARTRLKPGLLTHLHLHARAQRRHAQRGSTASGRQATLSERALRGLVASLRTTVEGLVWRPGRTSWSGYYAEAGHYTDAAMAHKEALVAAFLDTLTPRTVWDLGANTGRFTRLATERGANAVAWDADVAAVEANWHEVRRRGETDLLPLVLDLTNPSPPVGWAHEERMSLADRAPVDVVLALALVHHLAIGNNVPLPRVAAYLAQLAGHVVVEWVPKDDPKVATLLAARDDVFADYTVDGFERAIGAHFTVARREPLRDSSRTLYLLRRAA